MTAMRNRHDYPDPAEPTPESGGPERTPVREGLKRSRTGGVWVILISAAVVLLFLLIFILQNGQSAEVSFLGAHGTLPMGVALLLAAVFGVLLVALPGTARILQLRSASRHTPADRPTASQTAAEPRLPEGP